MQRFSNLILLLLWGMVACNKIETSSNCSPNVIVILADDMGYSDIACFGGEIETPHLDALAQNGIRFTDFYNSSRCCPSRAALVTGQYPHQVGMGCMVDWPPQAEAGPYQGYLPEGQTTIASALAPAGYSNYMVGKWHLGEEQKHWPLQYGFDRYFGLISGASSYFELIKNQKRVRQMASQNEPWQPPQAGFYMTDAFSDSARLFVEQHDKQKPFFIYLAYTAPHWPLHALEEDIARFEGKYMKGWDLLAQERFARMKEIGIIPQDYQAPEKPSSIPDWDTLTEEEQKHWDRLMAVYAAMIYRMDQGIGALVQSLKAQGIYENTVIVFVSDNGATDADMSHRKLNDPSVKAGLRGSYVAYKEPWAWLSNIPYKEYKKSSYWGGMRTPCIVSYPKFTENLNALSAQQGHFVDLLPTIMGLAAATAPDNYQAEGLDLSAHIKEAGHTQLLGRTLFMEHMGNKAVIEGKWKLLTTTWEDSWHLYDLESDPYEQEDLAISDPKRVQDLLEKYQAWEARTQSFPLPEQFLE